MATGSDKSMAAAIAALDAMTAQLDTGSTLQIFTGTKPANCAAAATGTLLSTHSMAADPWQNATDGGTQATAQANSIANATAADTGTAGYFRFIDNGGTCHFQGDVDDVAGGNTGDLNFDESDFTLNGTVSITDFFVYNLTLARV